MRERRTTRRWWLPAVAAVAAASAVTTGAPAAPAAAVPAGPAAAAAPAGPVGPAAAAGPVGPAAPAGPTEPAAPVGPTEPAAPVGPVGPVGPAAPTPWPPRVEVTDLPAGFQPAAINDRGLILGRLGTDVVVVDDDGEPAGTVGPWEPFPNPLCPGPICFWPTPSAPIVNDRGVVATSLGRHATLWDDGETTDLNGDAAGSWVLDLNDGGDALVTRFTADHQQVGLWDRGRFTEIGRWALDTLVVGRMSERGHVVLTVLVVRPPTPAVSSLLWHRGETTTFEGFVPRDVNRHGQVAGERLNPADPFDNTPAIWEDGEITLLPTLGGRGHGVSTINDRGQVAGFGTLPGVPGSRALRWDDGEIVDVGAATDLLESRPFGFTDRGDVLFGGLTTAFHTAGFVWDDGEVVRLPPADDGDVDPVAMNDRGQVVGTRRAPGPQQPTIPTLWER